MVRARRPELDRLEERALLDAAGPELAFGSIPLGFEPNRGQADAAVDFVARGSGYMVALAPGTAVLGLAGSGEDAGGAALRMNIVGADSSARASGVDLLPSMLALRQWGEKYGLGVPSNPVLVDCRDHLPIAPMEIRAHDGRAIAWSELQWLDRSLLGQGAPCPGPAELPALQRKP